MKKILLLVVFFLFSLTLSGCSFNLGTAKKVDDSTQGGVFKTLNKGALWQQKVLIPTVTGKPENIAALDARSIVVDPSDSKAIYFGSSANGLYYSYDSGDSWHFVRSLGAISVNSIAVDPNNKCVIYVASENKVFKSEDCTRTWKQIYYENNSSIAISYLAVDHYNSANIYMGNSFGKLLKSIDYGKSWKNIFDFPKNAAVSKILLNSADSRVVLVATLNRGLYKSTDAGVTFTSLASKFDEFKKNKMNVYSYKDMKGCLKEPNTYLMATTKNIFKTVNGGEDWTALKLLSNEKENPIINAVEMSQADSKVIYYITNTNFYSSFDNGDNWTSKKLPMARQGGLLLADPEIDTNLYMTTKQAPKNDDF